MDAATRGPVFFLPHIMKTGGTSFTARCRAEFPVDSHWPRFDATESASAQVLKYLRVSAVAGWSLDAAPPVRMVMGHVPLATRELMPVRPVSIVIVREPVARAVSQLEHLRRRAPQLRGKSIEEIYDVSPLREALLLNHQTRMLGMTAREALELERAAQSGAPASSAPTLRHLEQALAAIRDVEILALTERLPSLSREMTVRYGWRSKEIRHLNTSGRVEVPDSLRERISADNELDVRLYREIERLAV